MHGRVAPEHLGKTLIHEHVFNRYPWHQREGVAAELLVHLGQLHSCGVDSIVDLTTYTRLSDFAEVIEGSPVNIVCCAGFYLPQYIRPSLRHADTAELIEFLRRSVLGTNRKSAIRPGVLKVAGNHEELSPLEQRIFAAVAEVHRESGLPIVTHSRLGARAHLRFLAHHGVDPSKVLLSHLDSGLSNPACLPKKKSEILSLLSKGANILFTQYGSQATVSRRNPIPLLMHELAEMGYLGQLFASSDSNWKWRRGSLHFKRMGASAERDYSYVLTNGVPQLKRAGFSSQDMDRLFAVNPRRFLSIP